MKNYNNIYIAGAHSRAQTFGYYITYLDPDTRIMAYLYDNDEENPDNINGIPVIKINEETILNVDCPVYLGVRGVNCLHFTDTLKKCGMKNIIPVDVKMDLDLRNRYLKKHFDSVGRDYIKIDDLKTSGNHTDKSACIYVASSVFDKPLRDSYVLCDFEKKIQVGTALTDKRLEECCYDNDGDNISDRNKQFCELTGLYWIWKHAKEDIVGLSHYRRHFLFPAEWQNKMLENNVDVILPLPLYVAPNIEENYKSRHDASCWDYLMQYFKENNYQDFCDASNFFKETSLYSPCNMFVIRKEILNELCSWMFPVLFSVVEACGIKDDSYQNRYPGFISERLITFFFEKNRNKYRVVYADKNFLQ